MLLNPGRFTFDRQWIIPDARVITQPNVNLWQSRSVQQVFMTAQEDRPPYSGPSMTFTALPPDKHHFGGRSGRVFPLWRDAAAKVSNFKLDLLTHLSSVYERTVHPEDLMAFMAAIAAHPGFEKHFAPDLAMPGLRIPLTADAEVFFAAAAIGRRVIWLHSFGERMANASAERPPGAPRLQPERRPKIPAGGAIPSTPEGMPDSLTHDATSLCLHVGAGRIAPVPTAVWKYEVSGKQVLMQWFSSRRKDRDRPIIGDRRPPSALGDIQPETWLAEYTTELLDLLNVLGLLVELEPAQKAMLDRVLTSPLLTVAELRTAGALVLGSGAAAAEAPDAEPQLF